MQKKSDITILIASNHEITRVGICTIMQKVPGIIIMGEATNGTEARQLIEYLKPHVALLDLIMPGMKTADITNWAYKHHPETAVLIMAAHSRVYHLAQMLQAGAVGFLDKDQPGQEFVKAIHRAAQGQRLFTQEQQRRAQVWQENVQAPYENLTAREQEVLHLLANCLSNHEIAKQLQISENTVGKHVGHILTGIGATSRTEAAIWLRESGLVKRHN